MFSFGSTQRVCGTCDYWDGNRKKAPGNFVEVDNNGYCSDCGRCAKGKNSTIQGNSAATTGCLDWRKWAAL